jgi:hypothetical protein
MLRINVAEGEKTPMKKTVRSAILMVGLAGIFLSAAVPQVAALDGGMIIKKPVTRLDGGVIIKKPVR